MKNQTIIETLKEFGIETERELDVALKKSTFSLGIMAAGALASLNKEAEKERKECEV